ncbi:DUF1194 domain-containing protein [Rhodovulum iodosum]|nr:DUF1194 domain-containing protein [Rhodovulum robiginosum]
MNAALVAAALAPGAEAACRQALAIGLDVSGSVDALEYRLQVDGLAAALEHPEVAAALLAMPNAPVRLAVFEWAGQTDQRLLLPWAEIESAAALAAAAGHLRDSRRRATTHTTGLGAALIAGGRMLGDQAACWKRTLDVTGDGKSNEGPRPRDVRAAPALAGITVNALVIGTDAANRIDHAEVGLGELTAYFRAEVIRGADAFVETAMGFADFEAAMVRKLLRELEVPVLGLAR